MENLAKVPENVRHLLVCPVCKQELTPNDGDLLCMGRCGVRFPVVDGVPILINELTSVFSIDDFVTHQRTTFDLHEGAVKKFAKRVLPSIGQNLKGEANNSRFVKCLLEETANPKVLVIGAGTAGGFSGDPAIERVITDVSFGPEVMLVCDAHDIPFTDGSFDGVVVHAVLEHVADPHRCVEEIYRVLNSTGLVYADTPFMQQVHARQYDFERFTYLGHRRLFRRFEQVASGASCGPGMALAWAYCYFLLSFATKKWLRRILWAFGSMTSFYLKYFDRFLIDKPGTLDAASGYYFIGRKSDHTLTDKELVKMYKGGF